MAQFALPNHHPVPEGLMKCSDCHSTHGTSNRASLREVKWESCVRCHVEKRGPWVFEHASVRVEGCTACHTPHGSVNRLLLARREERFLCLSCHVESTAVNVPHGRMVPNQWRLHSLSFEHSRFEFRRQFSALRTVRHTTLIRFTSPARHIDGTRHFASARRCPALGFRRFRYPGVGNHWLPVYADVGRYKPTFTQMFDLNSGFRLMDLSLFGRAKPGDDKFADSYSLTLSGLGGDPYTTAQFTARKAHVYDLRVNFQQSRFYFSPSDVPSENGFSSVTDNHAWATVRKVGTMNLLCTPPTTCGSTLNTFAIPAMGSTSLPRRWIISGLPLPLAHSRAPIRITWLRLSAESTNRLTAGMRFTPRMPGISTTKSAMSGLTTA